MPRIQMTRTARIALYALPVYLLTLLVLIGIGFARKVSSLSSAPPPAKEVRHESTTDRSALPPIPLDNRVAPLPGSAEKPSAPDESSKTK